MIRPLAEMTAVQQAFLSGYASKHYSRILVLWCQWICSGLSIH